MMNNTLKIGLLAIAAGLTLVGCLEPAVPAQPTYERDIRPILVARCVRCHDSPGHADPNVTKKALQTATNFNFNFRTLADFKADTHGNLGVLKTIYPTIASGVGAIAEMFPMPPPPAEALEDWQIETLRTWCVDPNAQ